MKKNTLIAFLLLAVVSFVNGQPAQSSFGVTLCGAEFGQNNLPGILNTNYIYPEENEVSYFAKKCIYAGTKTNL